ncbi:MAG TPA: HyaD/HybD family hydrogenase maturation endopeptidase [Azospirillaceae bacterium]|nr:HyaD/HybD family hydrogenase maturation endopeptidase [Azospirillaceae bacterium]
MKVMVLGLGNILLSDEGIGVRVVEALEARYTFPPEVSVVDGGTSAMDMLDQLAETDHLIVTDAVKTGRPPATVVRIAGDDVPVFFRTKISPHQVGLCDVLATLTLMEAEILTVAVIGCEPVSLATSIDLSPEVAGRIDAMIALVLDELKTFGITATPCA